MKQFVLTSSMGKRLIAKAVAIHPAVVKAMKKGRVAAAASTGPKGRCGLALPGRTGTLLQP